MFFVNEKMFSTFGAENLGVGQAGVVLLEEERFNLLPTAMQKAENI
jgi:hypothetical protein